MEQRKKFEIFNPKDEKTKSLNKENKKLPEPLPKLHFIVGIIGPRGSGKSQLILNMLCNWYKSIFEEVILISPTYHNQAIWNCIDLDDDDVYTEYTEPIFNDILERIINTENEGEKTLLIFDDVGGSGTSKMNDGVSKLALKHRHYSTSIILSVQYIKMIGKSVRSNLTHLILFKMNNMEEVKDLAQELGIDYKKLTQILPKEQYKWILLDLFKNKYYDNNFKYLGKIV